MPYDYMNAANQIILRVGGVDTAFHDRVRKSLDKIGATAAGQALFAGIRANRLAGSNVGITPPGPNGISECACVSPHSNVSRTRLAQALLGDGLNSRTEINACLATANHANDGLWLSQQINATPAYDIRGLPIATPSNLGVTQQQADDWINGVTVFPAPFNGANATKATMALLTAFWAYARQHPGTGGHSAVRWNINSVAVRMTTGVRQSRSKSIGLAHELVHAYYNGAGLQMGLDNPLPDGNGVPTVPSAALFEYMCVGLGPWAAEPISENAVRAGWTNVVKNTLFNGRVVIRYQPVPVRSAY